MLYLKASSPLWLLAAVNVMDESLNTMNADQVAEVLGCSSKTVIEKASNGEIPGAKIGKGWIFRESDVVRYLGEEISNQTKARKNRWQKPIHNSKDLPLSHTGPNKRRRSPPDLSPYMNWE